MAAAQPRKVERAPAFGWPLVSVKHHGLRARRKCCNPRLTHQFVNSAHSARIGATSRVRHGVRVDLGRASQQDVQTDSSRRCLTGR